MLYVSRWKTVLIGLAVALAAVAALPNLFSDEQLEHFPSFLPSQKVTLGLDLRGGSHIMLLLERDDILKDRLQTTVGEVSVSLRNAGIAYTGLSGTGQRIEVSITDAGKVQEAQQALAAITTPISTTSTGLGGLTDGTVTEATLTDAGNGRLFIDLTDEGLDYRLSAALERSMDVVRRRIDEFGTVEPIIQRQGADRILVQVPGLGDPERLKMALDQAARLTFRMIDTSMPASEAIDGQPPASADVIFSLDEPPEPYLVDKTPMASGENVVSAEAGLSEETGEPVITVRFDSRGTERFAEATGRNVGGSFAIVLDNQVVSTPVINAPVTDGTAEITGFTAEGAADMASLLRAGALPAPLTVVEERTVGPALGTDSIQAGIAASIIGAVGVVAFMLAFYGVFGVMANIALAANVVMILAILSAIGSTLTLPGIAGIVLTMGMAVDSNVLVYERIREEANNGHPLHEAIDIGFRKAFTTILDANLTTLIAAIILFFLGSGPVRGFAVTLAIGIVTTVFTAFTMTQWLMSIWFRWRQPTRMPKGVRTGVFDSQNIRFMAIRNHIFAVTGALAIASIMGFTLLGLNFGIDFKGGSIIELRSKTGEADIADIRDRLVTLNLGEVQAQGFGDGQGVLVRVPAQEIGENAEQSAVAKMRAALEGDYDFRRVEVVGPSVSGDLTLTATIGVAVSLLAILAYIWFRFEWQFAVGAIIATLHDIILMLGFFVVTGMDFGLPGIAAILTIIGYSLNDTVVVYDRLRENMRRFKKIPLNMLIDMSINQTLSRTVLTGSTTLVALIALYLFGGEVIASFTLAMIFGVVVGTFSSIYIAAPVLIAFKLQPEAFDQENRPVRSRFGSRRARN